MIPEGLSLLKLVANCPKQPVGEVDLSLQLPNSEIYQAEEISALSKTVEESHNSSLFPAHEEVCWNLIMALKHQLPRKQQP